MSQKLIKDADGKSDFARGLPASSSDARALALERDGARIPTLRPARPRRREMTPRSSLSLSFPVEGKAGSGDKLCVRQDPLHVLFPIFAVLSETSLRGRWPLRLHTLARMLFRFLSFCCTNRERFLSAAGIPHWTRLKRTTDPQLDR